MLDKDRTLQAQKTKLATETSAALQATRDAKRQESLANLRKGLVDAGSTVIDQINQATGDTKTPQELVAEEWKKNPQKVRDASKSALEKLEKLKEKQETEGTKLKDLTRTREQAEGKAELARKDFLAALKELQDLPTVIKEKKAKIAELERKVTDAINTGNPDDAEQFQKEIGEEENRIDDLVKNFPGKWDQVATLWEAIPNADVETKKAAEQTQKDVTDALAAGRQDREQNSAKYIYAELYPPCPK